MTCHDMMDLMQRNLDADLSAAEEQTMLAHLQGCPECADLYERLKLLSQELAQLPKVVPPYSIVDSIMPQLEGAGGFAEPVAAAEPELRPEPVAAELMAYRRKKGIISWKIVTGVAAAGIVLGMFIFNGSPISREEKSAADLALQESGSSQMSKAAPQAFAAADSTADVMSGSSAGGAEPAAKATALNQTTVPPASAAPTPAAAAGAHPGRVTVASPGDSLQQPAGSLEAANQTDLKMKSEPNISSTTEPSEVAVEAGEQKEAMDAKKLAPSAAASEPSPESAPERAGAMALTAPAPEAPAAGPEQVDNKVTSPDKNALRSIDQFGKALTTIQPMVSADGRFTAQLDQNGVLLTGKDGAEWFRSQIRMEPGDIITFKGWSEGALFSYTITKPDGKTAGYRIAAETKQEMPQP